MGYRVDFRGGNFFLWNMNKELAAKVLARYVQDAILHRDSCYDPVGENDSLEDILSSFGWAVDNVDEQGNITYISFEGECLGDEDRWFDAISPYVRKGSWLAMEGEDGDIWCYYFDGSHCTTHKGCITFPSIPDALYREGAAICT